MVMQRSLAEIGYQAFDKQLLRAYGLFFNFASMKRFLLLRLPISNLRQCPRGQNQRLKP